MKAIYKALDSALVWLVAVLVLFLTDPQDGVNGGRWSWPWLFLWSRQARDLGCRKLKSSKLEEAMAGPWSYSTVN